MPIIERIINNSTKKIVSILCLGFILFSFGAVLPVEVSAQTLPGEDMICDGECPLFNPETVGELNRESLAVLIISLAQFITFIVGALAVLFIVLGGLMYTIDGGGGKRAEQGKKMAVNAIIGLVLSVAAYGAIAYLSSVLQSDLIQFVSD